MKRHLIRIAVGLLAALLMLFALAGAAAWWLARTSSGSAWLLGHVPGLTVQGAQGQLLGGPWSAQRVEYQGSRHIVIEQPAWADSSWQWQPHTGAWLGVALEGATAARVAVGPAREQTPLKAPTSLRLPFALTAPTLSVGELQLDGLGVVRDVRATGIAVGAQQGSEHHVESLTLRTARAQVQAHARIAADAPLTVRLNARLASAEGAATPWQGNLSIGDALAQLRVQAKMSSPRAEGATLEANATVTPFAAWPLAQLALNLRDLDLSALAEGAPSTRLSGRVDVDTQAADAPIHARVTLNNALPGRWDQGRLPLAALNADLSGSAQQPNRLWLRKFDARLADSAGRVGGQGQWHGSTADLTLRLEDVRPSALDARAAPMRLNGTATLRALGLRSPDGSAPTPTDPQRVDTDLALQGTLDSPPHTAVQVKARVELERTPSAAAAAQTGASAASAVRPRRDRPGAPAKAASAATAPDRPHGAAAWRLAITGLEASSGNARAKATLRAQGHALGAWTLTSQGELSAFDPSLWWGSAALRRGPATQLNGEWALDVQAPPQAQTHLRAFGRSASRQSLASALHALRGHAHVEVGPSRWLGLPVQARVVLDGRHPGWGMDADVHAAGNRAVAQGRWAVQPSDDHWNVTLQAPQPAALQPLWRTLPGLAALEPYAPSAGTLTARLQAHGRWPALQLDGDAQVQGWVSPALRATALSAKGQVGPDAKAPLQLQLDGQSLALAQGARIDTLSARIDGTLNEHRLALNARSSLRPPAWVDTVLGARRPSDGSRLHMAAHGRWTPDPAATGFSFAGLWRATLDELELRAPGTDSAAPWLGARGVQAQLQLDAAGRALDASAAPGKAQLLGGQVQWRTARWHAAPPGSNARSAFDLDLELEPLALAPLLQRGWPGAGLGGDLTLKGHVRLQAAERFKADVVLERASGDLTTLDDDGQPQPFGLNVLRLAMNADEGTWYFTQALASDHVGVLAGSQALRIGAQARWPSAESPMEGVVEWRIADLGAWARFTPPGWRVTGQLHTSAEIGGRFGAPEVRGDMVGSGLGVRNVLQGVDVRDGELALSLRGAQARVERFEFKGGDGTLRLTGGATLGDAPSVQLALQAERFRLLGRIDRRLVASGNAQLRLQPQLLSLEGRFDVDEGLFDLSRGDAPSLDSDVVVHGGRWGRPSEEATALPTQRPAQAPRDTRVAVQVDLGRDLKVRGRGLDTHLTGQLALTAPGGRLALNGAVRTIDGTYAAYGQKLDIERGNIGFVGPLENPRLDILAIRPHLDVRVGVLVAGTAQSPRVRLISEPEMSEFDKLSWLVLGRASDGLARADTALLQRAALALLAGEGESADAALLASVGLDDFSVRQTENGEVRDTVVSLGKQLSRRWYVGYERSVNATSGTWQLIYRAAQRFTVRARAGEDSALDAIWVWRWN